MGDAAGDDAWTTGVGLMVRDVLGANVDADVDVDDAVVVELVLIFSCV